MAINESIVSSLPEDVKDSDKTLSDDLAMRDRQRTQFEQKGLTGSETLHRDQLLLELRDVEQTEERVKTLIRQQPEHVEAWHEQGVSQTVNPATILMSATIRPPAGMLGAGRSDPNLRLQEYINAFKFYLSVSDSLVNQIVILENSDSDLSVFTKLASECKSKKAIHVINTSSDYPPEKGKGYGEFRMIDEGLEVLITRGAISKMTPIWKVTGRLIVKNIDELVRSAPSNYMVYCDLRNVPLIRESLGGNKWMDLRVFSFTYQGYMKCLYRQYDKSYVPEKDFFSIMMNALLDGNPIVPRFVRQPDISGFSGLSNKSYESPAYLTKSAIRQFGRWFLPWLWL